ncbi:universal stress protein [Pseudomonas sp. MWU13-2100]|uniref:universal stress protein n=1 Tax=Pseudomonas sp. MWU13-2100 TaxID=2935075 RepID=UPI00200C17FA|nr:universal stress protein [Pseudomonas sp. MWU13-2100]
MIRSLRLLLIAPSQPVHTPALEYAGVLAQTLNVALHLVAFVHAAALDVVGHGHSVNLDKARNGMMDVYRQWLNSEAVLLREKGIEVQYEVIWGKPSAFELATYARQMNADLIIKDLHEEAHLKRLVLSSLDWDLLCASPTSVLYIKQAPAPRLRKFLVAVDIELEGEGRATENDQVIRMARQLADARNASLHLITVYNCNAVGCQGFAAASSSGELPSYEARRNVFDALASEYGFAKEHRHFLVGAAANVIRGYVQRNAYDLLIIGSANHHLLSSTIGSTAEGILDNPACNVLALKLPPAASNVHEQTQKAVQANDVTHPLHPELLA